MSLYDDRILSIASLAGFWPLNETAGTTAADISGGGNDGTYTNTPTLGQGPLVYSSDLVDDLSADFEDTNSERVSIGAGIGASLLSGSVGATMELWVNLESLSAGGDVLMTTIVDGTSPGVQLLTFGGGADSLRIRARSEASDANQDLVVPSVITVGDVLHLVGVVDFTAGTSELYVNGVSVGSASGLTFGSATYNPGTPTGVDSIMANHDSTSPADGLASKATLYNTVLSAEDIALNFAAGSADGYDACALDLDPTGYWPLDEASGSALDRAGSANGTLFAGVTQGTASGFTNGTDDTDTVYTFDGVDDYVDLGTIASSPGTSDFTATCWITTTTPAFGRPFQARGTGSGSTIAGWQMSVANDGNISNCIVANGSGGFVNFNTTPSNLTDGSLHMLALVFDNSAGTFDAYIDGVFFQAGTLTGSIAGTSISTTRLTTLGAGEDGGSTNSFWSGTVAKAGWYLQALTASEISKLYTAGVSKCGLAVIDLDPSLYLRLNDTGATALDSSGNNLSTVVSGSPIRQLVGPFPLEATNFGTDFDATNDEVVVTTSGTITNSFTIGGWFRTPVDTPTVADQIFMSYRNSANDLVELANHTSGDLRFRVRTSASVLIDFGTDMTPLSDNEWHHFVGTTDLGTNHLIYIDGVEVASNSINAGGGTIVSSILTLGGRNVGGGSIDRADVELSDVFYAVDKIYTPAEILDLYTCSQLAPVTDYDTCALSLTPTGYWELSEASGNALDTSGNGNNGTLVGGVTQGATGGLTNGTDDSETAYTFDGVDDEVNLSSFDSEVFNIGTGDFSAHCWFRSTTGAGSFQQVLSFFPEVGSADRFAISLTSAGNIEVSVAEEGSGAAFIDSTSTSFAGDGLWHHVVLVRGSGVLSMYIDGLLEGTPVAATANINNDIGQDLLIGAGNFTAAPQRFTGDIQKVAVHTTAALTASEVSKLYTAGVSKCGLATLALSPDQYYTMSGTAGEVDASGNGQDAVTTVAPASTVGALTLETPNLGRVYTSTENLIAPTTIADLNVSGFTGSVWFRGNTAAADDLILSYRDSGNDLLHLTNAGGNIGIIGQVRSSGTALTVTPATLLATDNLYHMITLTYTAGGGMNIYVDGVSVVTDSTVMSGTISSSFVGIGAITITGGPPFAGNNANGDLDEAVFFGRTLSPAEVLTLYNCSLATNKFLSGNLIGCPTLEGWTVCAWDLANPGTLLGTDVLDLGTSAAYSIDVGTFSGAIIATSKANQGSVWVANEAVALDALRFPTDPATTPYFFKCTTAGTTGATEPAWVTPTGTTNDNTAVWIVVGELQQPQTQAPLFAV